MRLISQRLPSQRRNLRRLGSRWPRLPKAMRNDPCDPPPRVIEVSDGRFFIEEDGQPKTRVCGENPFPLS